MQTVFFDDGTILYIEDKVLKKIFKYAQVKPFDLEAGGVLLGKCFQNRNEYIISDVSEPSILDKRTRFNFVRSKKHAQAVINRTWKKSGGYINYIGEWHTHPETNPSPSQIDKNLLRQIISDKSNVFPKIFLLILGTNQNLYIGVVNAEKSSDISAEGVFKPL